MFRFYRAVAVMSAMLGAVTPAAAVAQATRAQIDQLLEAGWARSVQARTDAQQRYDRLAPLAASDPRIPYAYALIQIRQFRYPDAIKLLDQVIAADGRNLTARKLRVWLSVLLKDYGKALLQMPEVVERMPRDELAGEAETPYAELAAFLGRICGFLEGPVQGSVDQTARAACAVQLISRMTVSRRKAFETARKAVLNQFSAMGEETEMTTAAAKEMNEKVRHHVIEDLQQKSEDLAVLTESEKARIEELRKSLTYDLDKIASSQRRMQPELQQLQSQAVAVQQDLRAIDGRIFQLRDMAAREQDPDRRQRMLNDAAGWQIRRNERWMVLRDIDRRAGEVNAELQALERQRRDIERRWKRESGQVEKLKGTLDRVRSDKEKLEAKPADGSSAQVSDQKRRIVALTAYVPLPVSLDEERARLVEPAR